MIVTISYGWWAYDGDISYGRLTLIPYPRNSMVSRCCTWNIIPTNKIGIPVSTTFLVLSAFASTVVLEKMLLKVLWGFGIAAVVAHMLVGSLFLNTLMKNSMK